MEAKTNTKLREALDIGLNEVGGGFYTLQNGLRKCSIKKTIYYSGINLWAVLDLTPGSDLYCNCLTQCHFS